MTRTVQLLRHDAYNCPIKSAWCVQLYNYGSNQGCWWTIRFENFDIVMITHFIDRGWLQIIESFRSENKNKDKDGILLSSLFSCSCNFLRNISNMRKSVSSDIQAKFFNQLRSVWKFWWNTLSIVQYRARNCDQYSRICD